MGLRDLRVRLAPIAVVTVFGVSAVVAGAALVTVRSAESGTLGKILVAGSGLTLYHDGAEAKNVVKCTGSCVKEWPPLLVTAGSKPVAAPGVNGSLLGTVRRPDGKVQVTYRGMPLYLYSGDSKAGDVNGQGVAGLWRAIAPSGAVVTKVVTTSSSATGKGSGSATGSGTVTGSGTGYGAPTDPCVLHPDGPGCGM